MNVYTSQNGNKVITEKSEIFENELFLPGFRVCFATAPRDANGKTTEIPFGLRAGEPSPRGFASDPVKIPILPVE